MSMKTILLHLTNDERLSVRINVALNIAGEYNAHIRALYVVTPATPPTSFMGYIPPEFIERTRGIEADNASAASAKLKEEAAKRDISVTVIKEEGYAAEVINKHALAADIVIIGQVDPKDDSTAQYLYLADEMVIGCPCPILAVPYAGKFETFGSHILVGWNNTKEASRALKGAIPFMKKASKVTLLSVNPTVDQSHQNEAALRHLERHGITAEVKIGHWRNVDVGNALLDSLVDLSADMLVMGAYGHSRIREMILGGATKEILGHMTAPVLFSH
ncbi:MAG: universal stress protein [Sneathiella sp.]|nr:universal stress protein [Sneathiella sp.]